MEVLNFSPAWINIQLKELEKLGPKKGVINQSVKDVLQSLVNDNLVLMDKVGSPELESSLAEKESSIRELENNLHEQREIVDTQHHEIKMLNEKLNIEARKFKSLERESDRLSPEISLLESKETIALLGRLKYQRGNIEGALHVFDGIDLQTAIQRLQPSMIEKPPSRRSRSRTESICYVSQNAASLVLKAIYLKAMSLQRLGKITGNRVAVKYYSDDWPTLTAKLAFEKFIYTKTQKSNAQTEDDNSHSYRGRWKRSENIECSDRT